VTTSNCGMISNVYDGAVVAVVAVLPDDLVVLVDCTVVETGGDMESVEVLCTAVVSVAPLVDRS